MPDDLQAYFNGLTVGSGTAYRVRTISGLRDFVVRTSDESTGFRWGSLLSADMVESASIVIEFLYPNDPDTTRALETAFGPAPQEDAAALVMFSWKWPEAPEMYRMARCRRRQRVMTHISERTNGPVTMMVELQAPDPRAYSVALHTEVLTPFGDDNLYIDLTAGSGADAGINLTVGSGTSLGIDFDGTPGSGSVIAQNLGDTTTWPVVTFTAPGGMTRWRLRNLWTGGSAEFSYPLEGSQQLVVDFQAKATPKPGDVVLVDDAPRYSAWTHPRTPLSLPAGSSELRFDVLEGDETGATALIEWPDAWV